MGDRRVRLTAVAAGLALVGVSCSGSSGGSDGASKQTTSTKAQAAAAEAPEFVEGDCWWDRPEGLPAAISVTCGTIEVPADHDDPGSEPLHLAVARFHHSAADADEPPLVFLHGGPGGDNLSLAPPVEALPLDGLEQRDLILYDQRGAGRSTPSLDCPEKEQATLEALTTADPWDEEFLKVEAGAKACRDRLTAEGVDLADYTTPDSVEDLESVRQAFGAETWNVSGRSYGTRLGLAYARAHPDRVRTLTLDSVYSPDVGGVERSQGLPDQAIATLTEACGAQPGCLAANGQVDEQLARAVAAFDADPATADGTATVDGEEGDWTFLLDGGDLKGGMFAAQYRAQYLPLLPSIIAGLAAGDRSVVPAFIESGVPNLLNMSEGAFFSFECADNGLLLGEDGPAAMREDPGDDTLYALGTAEPFCQVWDVPPVDAAFNEPVTVDVPTLVFAGTLDPITPYAESKAQAERMPDARLVTVPGGGHGDQNFDDCTRSAATAFWADPAADLPACVDDLVIPPFSAG
ncbi:MAG: hypothetical protein JWO77_444 [Ilumatobacteraceae bacterium]|nr:hypothetical protein [Ilumatobacteraceae bacterium]